MSDLTVVVRSHFVAGWMPQFGCSVISFFMLNGISGRREARNQNHRPQPHIVA